MRQTNESSARPDSAGTERALEVAIKPEADVAPYNFARARRPRHDRYDRDGRWRGVLSSGECIRVTWLPPAWRDRNGSPAPPPIPGGRLHFGSPGPRRTRPPPNPRLALATTRGVGAPARAGIFSS